MKIKLIDFEDSFTFNIAEFFHSKGLEVEVIHWQAFPEDIPQGSVVILGPGPGHPREYSHLYPVIGELLKNPEIFMLGICLGHQLLWAAQGAQIEALARPIHGQALAFEIPPWDEYFTRVLQGQNFNVQVYHSLTVARPNESRFEQLFWPLEGPIMAARGKQLLSYQFHPESVGTEHSDIFFRPVLNWLDSLRHRQSCSL